MRNLQRFDSVLALAFEVKGRVSDNSISEDTVVAFIYGVVNAEQQAKPSHGIYMVDLEKARCAVYFLIDELLLDMNTCAQSNFSWYNYSLQRKFLESDRGGELFYIYFEKTLDELLLAMPIHNKHFEQKISKAQLLSENTSLSLIEKFRYVIQSASCLDPKTTESEVTSKLFMLATYAQCILFGFRGKYYDSKYDDMLKELRISAQAFLALSENDAMKLPPIEVQHIPHTLSTVKQKLLGYFFYACCPLLLCVLWYFYCAETIAQSIMQ